MNNLGPDLASFKLRQIKLMYDIISCLLYLFSNGISNSCVMTYVMTYVCGTYFMNEFVSLWISGLVKQDSNHSSSRQYNSFKKRVIL